MARYRFLRTGNENRAASGNMKSRRKTVTKTMPQNGNETAIMGDMARYRFTENW